MLKTCRLRYLTTDNFFFCRSKLENLLSLSHLRHFVGVSYVTLGKVNFLQVCQIFRVGCVVRKPLQRMSDRTRSLSLKLYQHTPSQENASSMHRFWFFTIPVSFQFSAFFYLLFVSNSHLKLVIYSICLQFAYHEIMWRKNYLFSTILILF